MKKALCAEISVVQSFFIGALQKIERLHDMDQALMPVRIGRDLTILQITPQDICVLQQLAEQVIRSLLVGMVTDGRGDLLDFRCGKTGIFQIGNCQFGTLFAMDAMTAVFGVQCDVVQPGSGHTQRTVQVSVHGQHRRGICSRYRVDDRLVAKRRQSDRMKVIQDLF